MATVQEILIRYKADIKDLNQKLDQVEKKMEGVQTETKKTDESFSGMSKTLNNVKNAAIAAFATKQIVDFGKEIFNLAGQLQGVKRAFDRLNDPGLLDRLRKATAGTVDDLELMKQAVRAENFKIPMDLLAKGLEFARRRAKETGEEIDYLVNSFTTGLGRKSGVILDNLGISLVELQKEIEKTGDFMTAVSNIIDKDLAAAGEDILTLSEQSAQLRTEWQNFKLFLAEQFTPVFSEILGGINGLIQSLKITKGRGLLELITTGRIDPVTIAEGIAKNRKEIEQTTEAVKKSIDPIKQQTSSIKEQKDAVDELAISWELYAALARATEAQLNALAPAIEGVTLTAQNQEVTIKGASAELLENKKRSEQAADSTIKQAEIQDLFNVAIGNTAQTLSEFGQFNKEIAFFEIVVNQAKAISAVAAQAAGLGPVAGVIAAISGIASFVSIFAQAKSLLDSAGDAPQFSEGVIDLPGKQKGKDSVLSWLAPGESVMTHEETKQHKDLFQAIRKKQFDQFMTEKYVLPAVKGSFAANMAESLDTYRLERAIRGNKKIDLSQDSQKGVAYYLAQQIRQGKYY